MKALLTVLGVMLAVTYPLLVYVTLGHLPVSGFAVVLLLLALLRWLTARNQPGTTLQVGILLLLAVLLFAKGESRLLRYYPVLMNAGMLLLFGYSLWRPPSVIEKLARLSEPDLPEAGIRYTRNVTRIWCGFFCINGLIALWTALFASWEIWTLYNGLIAYGLIGLLFGGEWLFRQYRRAQDNE